MEKAHTHRRHPPSPDELAGRRLIYIFGNPMNAVMSFFARREGTNDLHGFNNPPGKESKRAKPYWVVQHCQHLGVSNGPMTADWDLHRYLEHGEDLLCLEEHFDNWANPPAGTRVLLLRYETMWDHLPDIYRFVEIPESEAGRFPTRRQRGNDWRDLPPDLQDRLEILYGSLHKRMLGYPEISIIGD